MKLKPRLSPDDPLIVQALAGIYKSSTKVFFRIHPETAHHEKLAVCKALGNLDISYENKMELIHTFSFPLLAYCSELMKMKAAAAAAKQEQVTVEEDAASEEPEKLATVKGSKANKHYYIVKQGITGAFLTP